jgi:hypothetical protein
LGLIYSVQEPLSLTVFCILKVGFGVQMRVIPGKPNPLSKWMLELESTSAIWLRHEDSVSSQALNRIKSRFTSLIGEVLEELLTISHQMPSQIN